MIDDSYRYRIEIRVYRGDELESKQVVCTDRKLDTVILRHSDDEQEQE